MHLLSSPLSLKFPQSPSLNKITFSPKTLNPKKQNLPISCRSSNYFDQQRLSSSSSTPPSPSSQPSSQSRIFVGYSIYKGKAALTVEPRAPEFAPLDSGAFKVAKEGFILLQFAPAVGMRQYDWSRKQVFSLSVVEIGTLMSLGAKESCEFFHDPFKGRRLNLLASIKIEDFYFCTFDESNHLRPLRKPGAHSEEGKVRKLLKAEPLPDGTGHFFNLSVQNRLLNVDENIYIPISKAEFAVLNSTFNFILPHLLGWQAFANTIKPEDCMRSSNTSGSGAELEWGR